MSYLVVIQPKSGKKGNSPTIMNKPSDIADCVPGFKAGMDNFAVDLGPNGIAAAAKFEGKTYYAVWKGNREPQIYAAATKDELIAHLGTLPNAHMQKDGLITSGSKAVGRWGQMEVPADI